MGVVAKGSTRKATKKRAGKKKAEGTTETGGWKDVAISEAIGVKLAKLLIDGAGRLFRGGGTLGDLAEWSKTGHRLTALPRVGPVAARKIEEALLAYWEKHPQWKDDAAAASQKGGKKKKAAKQ